MAFKFNSVSTDFISSRWDDTKSFWYFYRLAETYPRFFEGFKVVIFFFGVNFCVFLKKNIFVLFFNDFFMYFK